MGKIALGALGMLAALAAGAIFTWRTITRPYWN